MLDLARLSALAGQIVLVVMVAGVAASQARSLRSDDASVSGVIPSPNQEFGDDVDQLAGRDIQRTSAATASVRPTARATDFPMATVEPQQQASNENSVPVYASPFDRADRGATMASIQPQAHFDRQESSHAPPNYAPRPSASAADLKTSASYGHHHHHGGHYGHQPSGWLDMGAWTGGKGAFGWYADYPVGGKHHNYGRK